MEAVLTLKASGDYSEHDLQRAQMLVDSIDRFWADDVPFRLHVVALDEDFERIRATLHSRQVSLRVMKETDLLPCLAHLPPVPGWNKQQALKLAAHKLVGGRFYMVFDADVVCCQPFSTSRLLVGAKSIVTWEPRARHPEWWQGSAEVLRIEPQLDAVGFSVTPEILSVDIVSNLERYIASVHGMDCWEYLLSYRVWTEFSLYSMFAMRTGLMERDHHSAEWMAESGLALWVEDNFWSTEAYAAWHPEASLAPGARGIFMICQSNARIDPAELRSRLRLIFETEPSR